MEQPVHPVQSTARLLLQEGGRTHGPREPAHGVAPIDRHTGNPGGPREAQRPKVCSAAIVSLLLMLLPQVRFNESTPCVAGSRVRARVRTHARPSARSDAGSVGGERYCVLLLFPVDELHSSCGQRRPLCGHCFGGPGSRHGTNRWARGDPTPSCSGSENRRGWGCGPARFSAPSTTPLGDPTFHFGAIVGCSCYGLGKPQRSRAAC